MKIIFADAETYYDPVYSLKNMTGVEYILDPRFESICWSVAVDYDPPDFLPRDEIYDYLQGIGEPYALVSHNALFDATILAYRYGIHPDILIDTFSMARAVLGYILKSLSLGAVSNYFGLEAKGDTIKKVIGMHYDDIVSNPLLWEQFKQYNIRDCLNCREIYFRLIPSLSAREIRIIDTVIRMVTQPRLILNKQKLMDYYKQVVTDKEALLEKCKVSKEILMSNQQFAEMLNSYGIIPPAKISPRTGKATWAFAKQDTAFMELCNHPDERVRDLMEARLGIRSTIEETRSARLIKIADATINSWGIPYLPVPLKYSGAHTHRLSGDWDLNLQNLSTRKQKKLREAIEALDGWVIIAVDAKQIEARLVAWMARQLDLVAAFRDGVDIYTDFANEIGSIRFTGKTCILGLGFGMGDTKLLNTLRADARNFGIDIEYTPEQTVDWVAHYRRRFVHIPRLWRHGANVLTGMYRGIADGTQIGPCVVEGHSIILPSGLRLEYNNLTLDKDNQWWYDYEQRNIRRSKIYGAKVIENVTQALDRQYVMDAAMAIEARCRRELQERVKIVLQGHDENVYTVPKEISQEVIQICYEEMSRPPWWGPDFPAAAEVKIGTNYADLEEVKGLTKISEIQN